jgi:hypothetical protein
MLRFKLALGFAEASFGAGLDPIRDKNQSVE